MKIINFLKKRKLPESFRIRYLSNNSPESDSKLKWIEEIDSKKKDSIINLVKTDYIKFTTLPDAFRICNSEKDVDKKDLSDEIKNIVKIKLKNFYKWKEEL
ncbi:hypothetical protein CMI40_02485 [Candidatus Pacearchaeota archaeon]|jgi:hypothetical protein|nr:hypothetical protein [Candidatus Pacearchaeota archaeon]|tara:strand:- start:4166 stop:4468 length:303 start_codon:yes stop_codon:yes gene_type:complete